MISVSYSTIDTSINSFDIEIAEFENKIELNLQKMLRDNKLNLSQQQKRYVNKLRKYSDSIIRAKPDLLLRYQKEFDKIISPKKMESKAFEAFRNRIILELGYKAKRTSFYPKYFYKIGIKSCVYCNAHLTVAIEEEEKLKTKDKVIYKAKFQVDHYWPQAKYPCFCISLYNLYPACGNCNNCKKVSDVDFSLYSNKNKNVGSAFRFRLDEGVVAKYLLNRKHEDITFHFDEPDVTAPYKKFQEVFDLEGIYSTQKDLAEELILKAEVYTEQYRAKLKKQFPDLFKAPGIFNRMLLGNYPSEQDMHKRPMAKFTVDIAKQVGLIKKK